MPASSKRPLTAITVSVGLTGTCTVCACDRAGRGLSRAHPPARRSAQATSTRRPTCALSSDLAVSTYSKHPPRRQYKRAHARCAHANAGIVGIARAHRVSGSRRCAGRPICAAATRFNARPSSGGARLWRYGGHEAARTAAARPFHFAGARCVAPTRFVAACSPVTVAVARPLAAAAAAATLARPARIAAPDCARQRL